MENLIPVLIAAISAVFASLITAWFLRRSSREANDTTAFKAVTDQLFALNKDLREELDEVKRQLTEVRATQKSQEVELASTRVDLETSRAQTEQSRRINRDLARYIKVLLARWPADGPTPPTPDPPMDWEIHL